MVEPADLDGYRHGLTERQLRCQACPNCGSWRWPPRPACPECTHIGGSWVPLPPTGTLYTWTVVARTSDPAFTDLLPYAVGMFEFAGAGIRVIGRIQGDSSALASGQPMSWSIEETASGPQPVWRPAGGAEHR